MMFGLAAASSIETHGTTRPFHGARAIARRATQAGERMARLRVRRNGHSPKLARKTSFVQRFQ
jgi:hypothetical protein